MRLSDILPSTRASFYLKIIKRFAPYLLSRLKVLADALDIRDFLMIGGLSLLCYGLYGYDPRLSYCTGGVFLMIIGYLMRGK